MGSCASSTLYATSKLGGKQRWESSSTVVNIVHLDGKLQQLKEPTKAWHVLSQNPNCFLCCSESMYVGSPIPPVSPSEELQLDRIYFLVPISKSRVPLPLQDLCALAIKANAALAHHSEATTDSAVLRSSPVKSQSFQTHPILSNVSVGFSH